MKMSLVISQQISHLGYDEERKALRVTFKSLTKRRDESTYEYSNVSPELYADILNAESIGRMINATVKADPKAFPCIKLSKEEATA